MKVRIEAIEFETPEGAPIFQALLRSVTEERNCFARELRRAVEVIGGATAASSRREDGLRPCPFCGSVKLENLDAAIEGGRVLCIDCGCAGPFRLPATGDGLEAWNMRHTEGGGS